MLWRLILVQVRAATISNCLAAVLTTAAQVGMLVAVHGVALGAAELAAGCPSVGVATLAALYDGYILAINGAPYHRCAGPRGSHISLNVDNKNARCYPQIGSAGAGSRCCMEQAGSGCAVVRKGSWRWEVTPLYIAQYSIHGPNTLYIAQYFIHSPILGG